MSPSKKKRNQKRMSHFLTAKLADIGLEKELGQKVRKTKKQKAQEFHAKESRKFHEEFNLTRANLYEERLTEEAVKATRDRRRKELQNSVEAFKKILEK